MDLFYFALSVFLILEGVTILVPNETLRIIAGVMGIVSGVLLAVRS